MVEKLLPDGLKLLIVGQTAVLSFIGCMILTMKGIAWGVRRLEKSPVTHTSAVAAPVLEDDSEAEAVAAAMVAAIHKKRTHITP